MGRRIIASLVALGALTACAHEGPPPAAGMAWSLSSTPEEGAKLAYGAPDSDNIELMLTCLPKSGQVQVWVIGPDLSTATSIQLRSGEIKARLPTLPAEDGYETLHAIAPADGPMFTSFARTGRIGASASANPSLLPTAGPYAARFLAACRR